MAVVSLQVQIGGLLLLYVWVNGLVQWNGMGPANAHCPAKSVLVDTPLAIVPVRTPASNWFRIEVLVVRRLVSELFVSQAYDPTNASVSFIVLFLIPSRMVFGCVVPPWLRMFWTVKLLLEG